ncbi:EipA family protein [Sphingomonas sp. BT-65]|uniref:EipA family protein n=1 Tax=Sphingomonas sp. BT-65 TaxID=2989821 RepID=UPI002235A552|nr:EipA family protein [Sphingomonas sp. BT-65]MCW4462546.1 EipA family protein [Sphingomonas sp. BT-65]
MRRVLIGLMMALTAPMAAAPALAQSIRTVDPNSAIDADLNQPQTTTPPAQDPIPADEAPPPADETVDPGAEYTPPADSTTGETAPVTAAPAGTATPVAAANGLAKPDAPTTFDRVRLVAAAEGVFGKGASGLAALIEDILKEQGEPNAYIAGSEGSGAIVVGLRYGSGQMVHAVEGERKVFWTGPSVGFDIGGDANKVFVLVYNLYDSQELYKRFPAGEGRLYFVGGFSASYLRRGDVVLIPVRLGVGWRAGANVGYMKFSEKSRWFPF